MGTHRFPAAPDPTSGATFSASVLRPDAGSVRITLAGEIDMSNADALLTTVLAAERSHGPRHIDVDLAGVSFLAASGVAALVRCHARTAESGCRLTVSHPQPLVRRVLEITDVLPTLTCRDAAVAADAGAAVAADAGVAVAADAMVGGEATAADAAAQDAPVGTPAPGHDATAVRQAARQARDRAQRMRRDNDARRARIRVVWAAFDDRLSSTG